MPVLMPTGLHFDDAMRRALALFDEGDLDDACDGFLADMRAHPATLLAVDDVVLLERMERVRAGQADRLDFEDLLWGFYPGSRPTDGAADYYEECIEIAVAFIGARLAVEGYTRFIEKLERHPSTQHLVHNEELTDRLWEAAKRLDGVAFETIAHSVVIPAPSSNGPAKA